MQDEEEAPVSYSVLTERLREDLDPFSALGFYEGLTLGEVLCEQPCEWLEPLHRPEGCATWYDWRRIAFFVRELQQGRTLDPIEIDAVCHDGHVYPEPIIVDGCHRACAHFLLETERMDVCFAGRVDYREWLTGETDNKPRV